MITSRVSVYGLSTRTVRTLCRKLGLSSVDCGLEGSDHLLGILDTKYGCTCHDDIRA